MAQVNPLNGKPRHPQSKGSIERANGDITKMLGSWMCENRTRDWSAGLPFVQFNKNIAYSRGVGLSSYKAVFGIELPIGMQTELSPSMYKQLQGTDITEEDLLTMNLIEEEGEEEDDPIGDQEGSREQDVEEHHCRQPPTTEAGNQNETIIITRDSEVSI
ncbi:KRAB-A domain-containing protein 2-like [Procambarus clarkii]|uniref:KRAB-A domain-containing protein 2-like n=1 Tax=Procambarus clarkii TaxID=6728 RepID=UPI003743310A